MEIYPNFNKEKIDDFLKFVIRARKDDVQSFNNLPQVFMSGRKVGKVPINATDISPTDRIGDFNYDTLYYYFVVDTGGGVAEWRTLPVTDFTGGGGGLGTVTNASVVTANGFAGTVATSTTTPAITLTTTITGLLKGNGTAISAASAGTDYEVPLTFSTGLTRTTNTITNNLSTGVSGGQTAIGGTSSGNSLTLSSTSHATKGSILFGTSAYDEVNNRLGVGTASPSALLDVEINAASDVFEFRRTGIRYYTLDFSGSTANFETDATTYWQTAAGIFLATDSRTDATTKAGRFGIPHYTNSEEPFLFGLSQSTSTANVMSFGGGSSLGNAATYISFYTAANNTTTTGTERVRIDSTGFVGIGVTAPTAQLHMGGNISASAWATAGIGLRIAAATYTNTSSSGVVGGTTSVHSIATPTFAASNVITYSAAATLQILGPPAAGSNVTITSPLAVYVASGNVRFQDLVGVGTIPTAKLHIDGNFSVDYTWTTTGVQLAVGTQLITDTIGSGAVTSRVANSFNTPTFASSNSVSITNAVTYYIQGAPVAGTNTTITNTYAVWVDSGNVRIDDSLSIGTAAAPVARLQMGGSSSQVAWGTSGSFIRAAPSTITDTSSATGTVASAVTNSFTGGTIAATNASVVYTNAASVYISNVPTAGTNAAFTAAYSLWVDAGSSRFDGNVGVGILTGELPENLLTLVGSSLTDAAANDQLRLRSIRGAIVAGSLIGGISFASNDSQLTAPGTVVSRIKSVSTVTQTSSTLSSDIVFESTNVLAFAELFRITGDGRIYGTALHNNAGSLTGTTNQYIASGTYTPTLTGVANVAASTSYLAQWMRVGNVVTVSGKVDVDPTAAVSTQLGVSLPIASNIANPQDCSGSAFCPTIAGQGAAILGDAANDRAQMEWIAVDITNQPMYFTFTYTVL